MKDITVFGKVPEISKHFKHFDLENECKNLNPQKKNTYMYIFFFNFF